MFSCNMYTFRGRVTRGNLIANKNERAGRTLVDWADVAIQKLAPSAKINVGSTIAVVLNCKTEKENAELGLLDMELYMDFHDDVQ